MDFIENVAFATVGDVMPLIGETITRKGRLKEYSSYDKYPA